LPDGDSVASACAGAIVSTLVGSGATTGSDIACATASGAFTSLGAAGAGSALADSGSRLAIVLSKGAAKVLEVATNLQQ
jgi:hypothetical protein